LKPSLLSTALLLAICFSPLRSDDTLWNLNFKDLKPGQAPTETPFTAPCAGPQKVSTDDANTLLGAATLGSLQSPLVFTKGSTSHYLPSLALKAATPYTSGTITVNFDLLFDHITPGPQPVETLMAFPFLNAAGGTDFILIVAGTGDTKLTLAGEGVAKGEKAEFTAGKVTHLQAVLDLDKHTFQAFLDNMPLGPAEHDDAKFSSFLGFTIRDGTAVGGNKGATFAAGIANLTVTHK
jgi:hypothetical protein